VVVARVRAAYLPVVAIVVLGHSCGPLRVLLSPLLAALLGVVDGNVGRCLLAAAWGHLPASLGRTMFSHHIAGGILGGDAAWILDDVPESIVVFSLAWIPHMAFR
jgi:hypothetical protein